MEKGRRRRGHLWRLEVKRNPADRRLPVSFCPYLYFLGVFFFLRNFLYVSKCVCVCFVPLLTHYPLSLCLVYSLSILCGVSLVGILRCSFVDFSKKERKKRIVRPLVVYTHTPSVCSVCTLKQALIQSVNTYINTHT